MTSESKETKSEAPKPYNESFHLASLLGRMERSWVFLGSSLACGFSLSARRRKPFYHPEIYYAFMSTIPFFAMMAMPLTIIVIAGEMDLSFPSIMAMGMVAFLLTYDATQYVWISFLAAFLTGLFIGWLNGIIVVKFGIPSLVATIGTQFFWRGAVLVLSQGKSGTLVYTKETALHPFLVGKIGGVFPTDDLA